jgi:hypothetical protein
VTALARLRKSAVFGYFSGVAPPKALAFLTLLTAACAHETARVAMAPGLREARPTISIVGIYREGRLSSESWDLIGPAVSPALGSPMCDAGYTDALRAKAPALYDAIDDAARREGLTGDVYEKLAPGAKGELLMVVQFYGAPPAPAQRSGRAGAPRPGTSPGSSPLRGRHGMSNAGIGGHAPDTFRGETPNVQLAASLYSIKERRIVGQIELEMEGRDSDEALHAFVERLGDELKGARCAGWRWAEPAAPASGPLPTPPPAP